ncbi:MAG: response regulator [Saprospiraceae bacterium]
MKILVVDDELDIKSLFEQYFRREIRNGELELCFAHSGESALDFFNSHETEVVLILSDINMPGMSGLQLLEKIRMTHPGVLPVIMMITAYGDEDNRNEALRLGANEFLVKPIDFTNLKEKLKSIKNYELRITNYELRISFFKGKF